MAVPAVISNPRGRSKKSCTELKSLGDLLDATGMDAIGAHQQTFDLIAELSANGF